MLADFFIDRIPFLVGIGVGSVIVIAIVVARMRRSGRVAKVSGAIVVVLLLALNGAGWVNRHGEDAPAGEDGTNVDGGDRPSTVPGSGKVVRVSIPGTRSGFDARDARVYLPPAYFAEPRPSLGVIVLLAGAPGTPEDWTRGGLADVTSDAYAATHGGVAPVLVMADSNGSIDADTQCVGDAEAYLAEDVPAFVAAPIRGGARGEAVGGRGLRRGRNVRDHARPATSGDVRDVRGLQWARRAPFG